MTNLDKDLKDKILHMPKTEIHVHVEGATDAETFYTLAKKNDIKLPAKNLDEWKSFFEFKDFNHFIKVYILAISALKSPEDYTYLIEQFYRHQSEQNIIYSEAFLSASFMVQNFNNDEIIEAIKEGIIRGKEKYKVDVAFIPDIARNIPDTQYDVLDLVTQGFEKGIFIGLGLGGMENGYPANLFTDTYKKAKKRGLRIVAHAGEVDGPGSIKSALHDLNVERIGHGVTCLQDKDLVAFLKDSQTPIEVCPGSNYCLGVTKKGENHQIRKMFDEGLFCTVNSDDPAMFSTSLTKEYELLIEQGFSWEEIKQLNYNNLQATFLSDSTKQEYKHIFEKFYSSNI
jgi:adenosine deaminase